MDDTKPDKTELCPWWTRLSGTISILTFAVTFILYRGIQTASVLQVVTFSTAYGLTLLLMITSIRGANWVNWILASVSGAGLVGMLWLMCIG